MFLGVFPSVSSRLPPPSKFPLGETGGQVHVRNGAALELCHPIRGLRKTKNTDDFDYIYAIITYVGIVRLHSARCNSLSNEIDCREVCTKPRCGAWEACPPMPNCLAIVFQQCQACS
jgi:hypothetical protein